jgi:hypothetical protein
MTFYLDDLKVLDHIVHECDFLIFEWRNISGSPQRQFADKDFSNPMFSYGFIYGFVVSPERFGLSSIGTSIPHDTLQVTCIFQLVICFVHPGWKSEWTRQANIPHTQTPFDLDDFV